MISGFWNELLGGKVGESSGWLFRGLILLKDCVVRARAMIVSLVCMVKAFYLIAYNWVAQMQKPSYPNKSINEILVMLTTLSLSVFILPYNKRKRYLLMSFHDFLKTVSGIYFFVSGLLHVILEIHNGQMIMVWDASKRKIYRKASIMMLLC